MHHRSPIPRDFSPCLSATALVACKSKEGLRPTTRTLPPEYRGGQQRYESDIVTAKKRDEYEDQGKGDQAQDPRQHRGHDHQRLREGLRALPRVGDGRRLETRFVRSASSSIEFTIETERRHGQQGHGARGSSTRKQDAKGNRRRRGRDEQRKAMKNCIQESIAGQVGVRSAARGRLRAHLQRHGGRGVLSGPRRPAKPNAR